ncbi:MAG TPA: UPF0261 family protein [Firmicutes bacterium]|nr:UPF0261 family protein [Bacillota bacterium]
MKVLLFGTFDSKPAELGFLKEALEKNGLEPIVVDGSCLRDTAPAFVHVPASEVARRAGKPFEVLAKLPRGEAIEVMSSGLLTVARELVASEDLRGAISAGGANGTLMASNVMKGLPRGMPKVLVSAAAAVNLRDVVGTSDMVVFNSVCDVSLNGFTRRVFANAANALAGMVTAPPIEMKRARGRVAMSMLGLTQPLVDRCKERLEEKGYDVLGFHANGYGGRALEEMVAAGEADAVLDVTLNEIINNLVGGVFDAGPDRLDAAVRRGIPMVLAPGAVDFVNFWARQIPEKFRDRVFWQHNVQNTLMRTSPEENYECGKIVGRKLSACAREAVVLVPDGFSGLDKPGGPKGWYDRRCIEEFTKGLKETLENTKVRVEIVGDHINSEGFANLAVARLLDLMTND